MGQIGDEGLPSPDTSLHTGPYQLVKWNVSRWRKREYDQHHSPARLHIEVSRRQGRRWCPLCEDVPEGTVDD